MLTVRDLRVTYGGVVQALRGLSLSVVAQNNAPAPVSPPDGSTPAAPSTPSDAATPDNPNGVKSPQQIYEQLLRLRQQQQQTSPN